MGWERGQADAHSKHPLPRRVAWAFGSREIGFMLNIQPIALPEVVANSIRKWLGADGAADFMQWLVTLDAILTAEAGNLLLQAAEDPSKVDEARAKADEAAEIRRFIERINKARTKDFQFEQCEIAPVTVSQTPNLDT